MGTLTAFENVTLDGYFAGPRGEMDFFKNMKKDAQFEKYTHAAAQGDSTLIFGRTTYELMKSYWPTPAARKADPKMAKAVDESPKLVFSKTLKKVEDEPNWKNVTVVSGIDEKEIARRKKASRNGLTILGSGSIVQQLSRLGLIDEYHLVVMPIVLGEGKSLFEDVETKLELAESKPFKNGVVLLKYRPA
jgi:dihydrofolate reductase